MHSGDVTDDGPTPLPQFAVNSPNSAIVADLTSIAHDLLFVVAAMDELAGIENPTDPSVNVRVNALWQAATIAYRRCFARGKAHGGKKQSRFRIPDEWIDSLDGELADYHGKLINLADQHVAHRVNDAQQARVLVQLAPPGQPRAVVGVGVLYISLQLPDDFITLGRRLAVALLATVQQNLDREYEVILNTARSKPIDDLYKIADVSPSG